MLVGPIYFQFYLFFRPFFLNSEKHVISSPKAIVFDPKLKKGKSDQYKKC